MRSLNIKDFKLEDFKKVTSEFISDTFKNFLDNFMYLVDKYLHLSKRYNAYKEVNEKTFSFLAGKTQTHNPLIITGYNDELSKEKVSVSKTYGVVTIEETTKTSLIPLADKHISLDILNIHTDHQYEAVSAARVYKNGEESEELRNIINETGAIWYEESEDSEMEIMIDLPDTLDNRLTYIDIFPYGGTKIKEISIISDKGKETRNVEALDSVVSGYPLRIFFNTETFANQIEIILEGYEVDTDTYFYSLGYVRAYYAKYEQTTLASPSYIEYDIGTPGMIEAINISQPTVYPYSPGELDTNPIDFMIHDGDSDNPVYSSMVSGSVLKTDINLNEGPYTIRFIFNRIGAFSPVFRKCEIIPKEV